MVPNERPAVLRYAIWAFALWSAIVGVSLYLNHRHEREFTLEVARAEAFANINKDLSFRRWATHHGGVYVPPDETTPPNPYLAVPQRDVVTTDGQRLTLMNPAYMIRQMQQIYSEGFGVRGHITSIDPINPANSPDAWEASVLAGFERGDRSNVSATSELDGLLYMRAMVPMITEAGCIKCHAHQGYRVGDVRGGISASVPLAGYLEREGKVLRTIYASHAGIWLVGLLAILWLYRRTLQRLAEREQAEREIRELNETLDRRVRERTAELERANQELKSFSYSVSHDLRAPLRALGGFARVLQHEDAGRLSDDGRTAVARIEHNAERMSRLIDDMLEFSRAGSGEMARAEVDMSALAHAVAEELRAEYPSAQLRFGDLPPAMGDAAMLRQVWANLIGNAFKFSAKRERPEIEIGSETQAGATVYFVRDNGAGFDMAWQARLFSVFQRLHSENDYPGTGAGLAIVKRIVERHGGRVWADGEVGQGAVLRFTLGA